MELSCLIEHVPRI